MLAVAADGWTCDEIGERLGIKESTVKAHLGSLYRKFGAANRAQLVSGAMALGIGGDGPPSPTTSQ